MNRCSGRVWQGCLTLCVYGVQCDVKNRTCKSIDQTRSEEEYKESAPTPTHSARLHTNSVSPPARAAGRQLGRAESPRGGAECSRKLGENGLLERGELVCPLLGGGVLFGVGRRLAQQEELAYLVDVPIDLAVEDQGDEELLDLPRGATGWSEGRGTA